MSHQTQLIGIIEMATDPQVSVRMDATIGDMLRSLRRDCGLPPDEQFPEGVELEICARCTMQSNRFTCCTPNLPQLRADLEHELRRLIQKLLAAM